MKRKKILPAAGAFLGMLILILDGRTALRGAQLGIDLCTKTAIPALFPFFVLSILLTNSLAETPLAILRPAGRLLGIPHGCESILISGFLGGYPAGAQCVAELYRSGKLDKQEAERLLAFCSNAGPAFLFGILGVMFPKISTVWLLWAVHITAALLTAMVIRPSAKPCSSRLQGSEANASGVIRGALWAMGCVCAWIILFRILLTFLDRWFLWLLPTPAKTPLAGILELSNGCLELGYIPDLRLRFVLCSGMLAWGGLCVAMQTLSVTGGLSLKQYLLGKSLQTLFSVVLCLLFAYGIWTPAALILGMLLIYLTNKQKNGSNQRLVGV